MLQSPFTVSATASSGLAVTFSTTTPSVCTSSGTQRQHDHPGRVGDVHGQADQAGNATYNAATSVSRVVHGVEGESDDHVRVAVEPDDAQSPFTVSATASSGLAVTFSTTTPSVCTSSGTNGSTITLIARGTCTVRASQAGNATYNAATSVNRSFTVS